MTVVVLGADGFIGQQLIKGLEDQGLTVLAIGYNFTLQGKKVILIGNDNDSCFRFLNNTVEKVYLIHYMNKTNERIEFENIVENEANRMNIPVVRINTIDIEAVEKNE